MSGETAKIAGSIKIEERAVPLHTMVQKRGLSNPEEAAMTGEKRINKGTKIRAGQSLFRKVRPRKHL